MAIEAELDGVEKAWQVECALAGYLHVVDVTITRDSSRIHAKPKFYEGSVSALCGHCVGYFVVSWSWCDVVGRPPKGAEFLVGFLPAICPRCMAEYRKWVRVPGVPKEPLVETRLLWLVREVFP